MPAQMQHSFKEAVNKGGFKTKATCLLASRPIAKEGVLLLGDSLNMRHPVTGGGMTVALTDIYSIAKQLNNPADLDDKSTMRHLIHGFYRQRHKENATINILAFALYSVFRHRLLKKACFNYLQKGGVQASEPMSLLSGLSRNRLILFKHFFAVALYALTDRKKILIGTTHPGFIQSTKALFYSIRILIPLIIDEIPRIFRNRTTWLLKPK
jgi:squalene monooxygenase